MRASHDLARVTASFDDASLVPSAGLLAPAILAQRLDLAGLIDRHVDLGDRPGAANRGTKALTLLGAMLAGGDSIDDCELMRTAGLPVLFPGYRAPLTIGTYLRAFRWHNVRQLDAVSREVLARLFAAGAGPADLAGPHTIDLDSTICPVYGRAKQGAAFGYTKVRGLHPLLATLAETGQVLHTRLRGGNAGSARGAASFLAETVSRLRSAGASGPLTMRADSAFYSRQVLGACRRHDVRFSVTVRQDRRVRRAIEAIPEQAWTPIPYWLSTPEVSGADVAEVPYRCRAGRHAITVRLIVRRVRPTAGSQLALFTTWDYHAFVTDRDGDLLDLEADHRRHAIVEQVIADLKAGPLAHLPSGRFAANAAWTTFAAMAHNLTRAVGIHAGDGFTHATGPTIRRKLINVPGRLVRSARRLHLRLPRDWPWERGLTGALTTAAALPQRR